jgi:hypothetical protein
MPESPNLGIVHLTQGQNQKHATVNTAFDLIDNAQHREFAQAVDDDGDTTLSEANFQANGRFDITGSLAQNENINLSASVSRLFRMQDSTTGGFDVTCQVTGGGGDGVVLQKGVWMLLYTDGTDVTVVGFSSAISNTFLAAQKLREQTLTVSGGVAISGALASIDWTLGAVMHLDVAENFTLDNPVSDPPAGESVSFEIILTHDVTGGHTITIDAGGDKYAFADGVEPVLSTGGGDIDRLIFTYDSVNDLYHGTFVANSEGAV